MNLDLLDGLANSLDAIRELLDDMRTASDIPAAAGNRLEVPLLAMASINRQLHAEIDAAYQAQFAQRGGN